ncbi:uncharacterized protein EDB91DRAFT_894280 [Suillus paluster]|uniref:uncharacterized protein n=1 Tax=Suillus paluster TaxID=48578 RepID=UPI001B8743A0|nr:uncharacterized protein EDB91DRAFT_894280 [Suillus paluster]KAG1727290.1 hypothetical protein EDB91DRAFT_894280 [Suillus paluster]
MKHPSAPQSMAKLFTLHPPHRHNIQHTSDMPFNQCFLVAQSFSPLGEVWTIHIDPGPQVPRPVTNKSMVSQKEPGSDMSGTRGALCCSDLLLLLVRILNFPLCLLEIAELRTGMMEERGPDMRYIHHSCYQTNLPIVSTYPPHLLSPLNLLMLGFTARSIFPRRYLYPSTFLRPSSPPMKLFSFECLLWGRCRGAACRAVGCD